jgi:uncharacterized RDD family membrane protein YckC
MMWSTLMQWYYADQGRQIGPVEETGLDDLVRAGLVRDDTLVWHDGMGAWQAHGIVRGRRPAPAMPVLAPVGAGAARYCGECGLPFNANELVTIGMAPICATCKPIFLQRIREGGQALGTLHYGGFWIRLVAYMVDGALLGVAGFLIGLPLRLLVFKGADLNPAALTPAALGITAVEGLLNIAMACAYEVYFISTRGATIGKQALGLKVVRIDGSAIPLGLAFGRYFAKWINVFTLYIGYIMAGFDEQKRALHDRICDTRVIYSK